MPCNDSKIKRVYLTEISSAPRIAPAPWIAPTPGIAPGIAPAP